MNTPVLVFDATSSGHRGNYVREFARLLGGLPLIGSPLWYLGRLLAVRRLLLPTFETMPRAYFLLAFARMLLIRRTVLFVLRPQVAPGQWVKLAAHRLLAVMPGVRIATIFPISPESHLYGRSTMVLDLEYWDQAGMPPPAPTPLSDAIRAASAGRRIVAALGYFSDDKGGNMLVDLAELEELAEHFLFVVAGIVQPDVEVRLDAAPRRALFVEKRKLSNAELMSIYTIADLTWCCYAPGRDISSGIFGRSLQFGVPAIVREGSLLQRQSDGRIDHIAAPWADSKSIAQQIVNWTARESYAKASTAKAFDPEDELLKLREMLGLSRTPRKTSGT
jgi:hypothetical protein